MATIKTAPGHFDCEAAYTPAVYNEQGGMRMFKSDEILKIITDRKLGIKPELSTVVVPVALRWRVSPDLGLPFSPFYVWRKIKKTSTAPVAVAPFQVPGKVLFLNGPFYRLGVTIKNNDAADRTFTITPLDHKYLEYGAKSTSMFLSAGGSGTLNLDQPNVSGLSISGGNFSLQSGTGILMQAYVNDPEWKMIQVVGIPFKPGSIDPFLYSDEKQGFVQSLTDPETACKQRIDLYTAFYKPPATTTSDGSTLPAWKTPSGDEMLAAYKSTSVIKNGVTGTLNDLQEMLEKVYSTAPALYAGRQKRFLKEIKSMGVADPANPNPKYNGTYQIPVCSSALLSATTENWNALGLGFGTMDFAPGAGATPAAVVIKGDLNAYDYMVTARFRTPVISYEYDFPFQVKEKLDSFEETEYAALCHFDIKQPAPPAALLAETIAGNRPFVRDDNFYDNVRLSWISPEIAKKSPLCYAVAFKNNMTGGTARFLNDDRLFIGGKPLPFVPASRSDSAAPDPPGRDGSAFERFFHDRSPVPFAGSILQQYYIASTNVFGLWSPWIPAPHTLTAKPPQIPRIVSAAFVAKHEGVTTHIYDNSKLEIIVSYDWEDRTPFEIQLAGYFVSPPVPDPPVTVSGIVKSNAGGAMDKYTIRFTGNIPLLGKLDASNNFSVITAAEGEVVPDPGVSSGSSNGLSSNANPDIRTYRVRLKQVSLNFTSQTKVWFAIYTRGSELKNQLQFSAYSKPVVIQVADPVPRDAPVFAPDIKWASLPDATNTSRYHLKFSGVTGAVGYAVYRATELSLRDRMTGILSYPANGTIFQRRDALNAAGPSDRKKALDAFIRVNKKLLTATELELEMNGDTGGLFIYAVSSFTEQGAESRLSDWIYVAVPEKITPSAPVLLGFVNKKAAVPQAVLKVNLGGGNNTSVVEIFRTTKKYLGADINLMGLPAKTGPAAGWNKFKTIDGINDLLVTDPAGSFDYYKIEENIVPGWAPVYFRAVSLGLNQPANGKMPGRSPSSNLLELLPPPPAAAPLVSNVSLTPDGAMTQLRLTFRSNAYPGRSPHGMHTMIVYSQNNTGLWDELAGGNIPGLKKINPGEPETLNSLIRTNTEANGLSNYVLNIPAPAKITLKIVVADPLGRKGEAVVSFAKPAAGVEITGIQVKKVLTSVNVAFKTNVGKTKPPVGQFTLEILLQSKTFVTKSILQVAMHAIPDTLPIRGGTGISGGAKQDAGKMYSYVAVFAGLVNLNAFNAAKAVIIQITDPKGKTTASTLAL